LNCQKLIRLDATNNLLESLEEFAMGEYLDLQRLYLDDVKLLNLPGLE
jgi:Leucine-rich repeat (LRR) protein